ncbi:MAG: hypothetical protein LW606_09465 [Ilumatobacteraceae bacterium]|nr:hypothetical protein [Ilumatobacteraceae bacterium]
MGNCIWRVVIVSLVSSSTLLPSGEASALSGTAVPVGAVVVQKVALKPIAGGYFCRKTKSTWIPGTLFKSKYFVSHSQQVSNYLRQAQVAEGARKTLALRAALRNVSTWRQRYTRGAAACSKFDVAFPPPVGSPRTSSTTMPLNSAEDVVKFDLSESVGVVLESSGVSASAARTSSLHGQLLSLTSQGLLKPALSGTSARIHEIYAAPNNKLYVAFDERVKIESTTCILVEVDEASSAASCVDPDLMSVTWKNPVYKNSNSNPPIQVGRDGSIVYQGATQNRGVLRRKRNGKVSDILAIGGALELGDFLLASDGSVVQSLSTYVKTKCGGITRVLLEGQLDTLSRCERALFIYEMPDGKVWMAINDPEFDYAHEVRTSYGIRRFDLLSNSWVSEAVDALGQRKYFLNSNIQQFQYPQICDTSTLRPWIGQYNGERLEPDQRSAFWANYGFCSSAGGGVSKFFRVGANMVFALSGRLMRYYPTIAVVNSSVRLVSHSFAKDDLFFLSGKDSDFNHITTVYSAATDTESIVSELSGQFEIVRIGGSGATGTVYFQGRRLRDNQLVNGTINLLSMEVKILASQSSEWSNIQVFG